MKKRGGLEMKFNKVNKVLTMLTTTAASAVLLAACGSGSTASSSTANSAHTPTTTQKAWVVGMSGGYYGNTARVEIEAQLQAYAALPTVAPHVKKLIINNAGTSVAAQVAAVDSMIAQHVNAIILDSNSLTGLNPAIAQAHQAGIVVVTENDKVTSPYAYQVQTLGKAYGAAVASKFVSELHGKGNIVVLRGIAGNAVDAAEAAGFNGVFQKNPGIHVLAVAYPQWDEAQAQTDMANLLSRYHNINGVFTEGGMAQGVVNAYKAANRKFVPVAGGDTNGFSCQLKKYQANGLTGVQGNDHIFEGALALKTTLAILGGAKEPKLIPVTASKAAWGTATAVKLCQPSVSANLFVPVGSKAYGINLTLPEVQKFM